MIGSYNGRRHDAFELGVITEEEALRSPQDQTYQVRRRLHVSAKLVADSQAQLLAKIESMRRAYRTDGKDFVLQTTGGQRIESHSLFSRQTVGGVRVVKRPSFTQARGGELGLYATYELVLEADFPEGNVALLFSTESVQATGTGGLIWRHRPVIAGRWPRQTVNTHSTVKIIQQGQAVGHLSYPPLKRPLLPPQFEHQEERLIERHDPERHGDALTTFRLSWRYVFEQG